MVEALISPTDNFDMTCAHNDCCCIPQLHSACLLQRSSARSSPAAGELPETRAVKKGVKGESASLPSCLLREGIALMKKQLSDSSVELDEGAVSREAVGGAESTNMNHS